MLLWGVAAPASEKLSAVAENLVIFGVATSALVGLAKAKKKNKKNRPK